MSSGSNQNWFFNPIEQSRFRYSYKSTLSPCKSNSDPEGAREFMAKEEDIGSICNTKYAEAFARFQLN